LPLVELGVVNNSKKEVFQGKIVASFAVGNRALYDFLDDNPLCHFDESSFVNDPAIIKRNSKMTSVNSCIEVDLTGQVVSDSIGTRMFSGFGGQTDFARGAALSEGGLPIIALPSSTSKGESRIVPTIKQGAGVVTTRAHVHYVCTEYGIVDLWGKSLRERAALLVSIAHPSAREGLEKAAFERFGKSVWTGYTLHSTKQA
jgi:acyl-CoA hydrolase